MELQRLGELMPNIQKFLHGIGWDIPGGEHKDQNVGGRPSDAFLYVVFGKATYCFGDYTVEVKAGDLLYLAKGCTYDLIVPCEKYGIVYANFLFDLPEGTALRCEAVTPLGGKKDEHLLRKIVTTWHMQPSTMQPDCLSMLYTIYSDFLKAKHSVYLPAQKKARMEKAREYIDARLSDSTLNVPMLAETFKMSESHFRYSFRQMYTVAPAQYIRQERIRLAKALLRETNDTLTKIAEDTGFSSIYYFSDTFKREVKCSPGEYRKRMQVGKIKL